MLEKFKNDMNKVVGAGVLSVAAAATLAPQASEAKMTSSVTSSKSFEKEGISFKQVVSDDMLKVMQEVALKYGITIKILHKEGEEYTHVFTDLDDTNKIFNGVLEKGYSYIEISSEKNDLSQFWSEVNSRNK